MTKTEFLTMVASGPVFLDGATGTGLQQAGMPRKVVTELWVDEHPQLLLRLQRAYVEAGSRILYAPTFQANPVALDKAGWTGNVEKLNTRLVRLSREAAGTDALVAGDIATLAGVLDPWEGANFNRMVECYRRQIGGILEGGVDFLAGETLLYPQEAEAIFTAAQLEAADVPVTLTFTMDASGSFFSGQEAGPVLRKLEEAGASAVGFNCVAASEQLPALVSRLRRHVRGPLISKPNAGNPVVGASGLAEYPMEPRTFAEFQYDAFCLGAGLLGGCCGTTPDFIRELKNRFECMSRLGKD